jgi:acetyl esterase/lipase
MFRRCLLALALSLPLAAPALGQEPSYTRTEDVIYGRKFGVALTMDVFAPKGPKNGAGVVFCVSGGWFSAKESINPGLARTFTDRGYVVFAVVHGSQPKFSIPEVLDDMNRAVRYIRYHAKEYGVDKDRLGIAGASAGGHLSLMQGTAPRPGNPEAKDPVDRESSKVAAVGCFFPPTDFLNYGEPGRVALGRGTLTNFRPPFDFTEQDPKTRSFSVITDEAKRQEIGRAISPAYHVTADSAPALIIHGDADKLVPIQQAELIMEKYKEAGVAHELVVKKGMAHGWPTLGRDVAMIADWFDKQLVKK